MAAIRLLSRVSRSTIPALVPSASARSTSAALAARITVSWVVSASAIAVSAASFSARVARASTRDAARARVAASATCCWMLIRPA